MPSTHAHTNTAQLGRAFGLPLSPHAESPRCPGPACAGHHPPQGIPYLIHDIGELINAAYALRSAVEANRLTVDVLDLFDDIADTVQTSCRWLAAHSAQPALTGGEPQ